MERNQEKRKKIKPSISIWFYDHIQYVDCKNRLSRPILMFSGSTRTRFHRRFFSHLTENPLTDTR